MTKPKGFDSPGLLWNLCAALRQILLLSLQSTFSLWHLKNPVNHGLEPLLGGYRTGLETGDMEFGSSCYSAYVDLYLFCGLPLLPFVSDVQNFGEQLRLCRQDLPLSFILPYYNFAMNMCGLTDDPITVSWETGSQFSLFSDNMTRYNDSRATMNLYHAQLLLSYVLRDTGMQAKAMEDIRELNNYELDGTHFSTYFYALVIGLSGIDVYRTTRDGKYLSLAKRMIRWLKQVLKRRYLECVGCLKLLEANVATLLTPDKTEENRESFDQAISLCARSGFTHFCALACESCGRYLKDDTHWSEIYIERAALLYEEWGATVKVEELAKEYYFIVPGRLKRNDETVIHVAIRGRERFDTTTDDFQSVSDCTFAFTTKDGSSQGMSVGKSMNDTPRIEEE